MTSKSKQKESLKFSTCEICKYNKFTTRHRLRPGRKKGEYVAWNVLGACPNCHMECELGIISPYIVHQTILKRIRKELQSKRK